MGDLIQFLFIGVVSFALLWFAKSKGFFQWNSHRQWDSKVYLIRVIGAFAVYYVVSTVIISLYRGFFASYFPYPCVGCAAWLNFLILTGIFTALAVYWRTLPLVTRMGIVRAPDVTPNYKNDFLTALFAWVIAFPLVLFLSGIFEWIVLYVFNVTEIPDQQAVLFVKATFANPVYFTLAIITVVVITPFVEELLFRGFLQSFIRRHLGSKQAILITSACFSAFHYDSAQGYANIPIVGSLFFLALFLGYLYEKQGSLFASICLHGLFNAISILNLYFFGGIPCFF